MISSADEVISCSNQEVCGEDVHRDSHHLKYLMTRDNSPHELVTTRKGVHIAVVACGDRLDETLTMIKSVLLFSIEKVNLHIFADDELKEKFECTLKLWKAKLKDYFCFDIYPIQFPLNVEADEWKNLFKLCASQRLFIPDILKGVDSLIYVDTDILFMRPMEDLWRFFNKFNETQVAGVTAEHEEPQAGWYNRFALHPYVPPYGINSGVMLMNLTRIRNSDWLKDIIPYYKQYRYKITWGDQDLLNIYFHHYPEKLYQFSCAWNYRPDHCMYMSTCKDAEEQGVSVLHGNRGTFHNDKMPLFKAIYDSFHEISLVNKSMDKLKIDLEEKMRPHMTTQCGKISDVFTKTLFKHLK